MALARVDTVETVGIVVEMRAYAQAKRIRNDLIVRALNADIPIWRIAEEMTIDPKTVTAVRDKNRNPE